MLVALAALACTRAPATDEGVLATERQWVRALEARDVKALACILAPEFADTNWRGEVVSRQVVLDRLPTRPPSTLKLSNLSVSREGGFALVRGTNTQTTADGRLLGSVNFTDMFVYRGGAWRAISAQETVIAKE
jgi:hypothetical protein